MPHFCSFFIDSVKLFTAFESSKVFETANLFLPLALRAEMTFLPFLLFIRVLKPCVLLRGVLCG